MPLPIDVASLEGNEKFIFSICTLVNNKPDYIEMVKSFHDAGFDKCCEYLYIDNINTNAFDAYKGINKFLTKAEGKYVIVVHQDVLASFDTREDLERRLKELDNTDPKWAICGNSGGIAPGKVAIRLTDPHATDRSIGAFPCRVYSLDENFLLIKRGSNVSLSSDLDGFHLYGTDICLIADALGWNCYVIDFHLHHLSGGRRDLTLERSRGAIVSKYRRALRSRWVNSPCELFFLTGSQALSFLLNQFLLRRILIKAMKLVNNAGSRVT